MHCTPNVYLSPFNADIDLSQEQGVTGRTASKFKTRLILAKPLFGFLSHTSLTSCGSSARLLSYRLPQILISASKLVGSTILSMYSSINDLNLTFQILLLAIIAGIK